MDLYKAICCKERNRDHARRTRLRKKLVIDGMRNRMVALQEEGLRLQAMKEEKDMAAILMGLGGADVNQKSTNDIDTDRPHYEMKNGYKIYFLESDAGKMMNELRIAVRHESASERQKAGNATTDQDVLHPIKIESHGEMTSENLSENVAGKEIKREEEDHASDSDSDSGDEEEHSQDGTDGSQSIEDEAGDGNPAKCRKIESTPSTATSAPVEMKNADDLRRERNKIHARLTRDRKKIFTSRLSELIRSMEEHAARMRYKLGVVGQSRAAAAERAKARALAKGPLLPQPKVAAKSNAKQSCTPQSIEALLARQHFLEIKKEKPDMSLPQFMALTSGNNAAMNSNSMNAGMNAGMNSGINAGINAGVNVGMNAGINSTSTGNNAGLFMPNVPLGPGMYPFPDAPMPGSMPSASGFPGATNSMFMMPFQGPFDPMFPIGPPSEAAMQQFFAAHPYFIPGMEMMPPPMDMLPPMDMMPFMHGNQMPRFDMFPHASMMSLPPGLNPGMAQGLSRAPGQFQGLPHGLPKGMLPGLPQSISQGLANSLPPAMTRPLMHQANIALAELSNSSALLGRTP